MFKSFAKEGNLKRMSGIRAKLVMFKSFAKETNQNLYFLPYLLIINFSQKKFWKKIFFSGKN